VVRHAYEKVLKYWDETLGAIEIKTPDAAIDLIHNRWLLYQKPLPVVYGRGRHFISPGALLDSAISSRMHGSGIYQPANGERSDTYGRCPEFTQGECPHWWHPPTGRGVRTRFSDDLIWLPYVMSFMYRSRTTHRSSMRRSLSWRHLNWIFGIDEAYILPTVSNETGSLFEHSIRALDRVWQSANMVCR